MICGIDGNVTTYSSGCDLIGSLAQRVGTPPNIFLKFSDHLNCLGWSPCNTWRGNCKFDYATSPGAFVGQRNLSLSVIDCFLHCKNIRCSEDSVARVNEFIIDVDVNDHFPIQSILIWSLDVLGKVVLAGTLLGMTCPSFPTLSVVTILSTS